VARLLCDRAGAELAADDREAARNALREAESIVVALNAGGGSDASRQVLELRKQIAVGLQYDTIGESVGFFRFRESTARRLADIVAGYVASGRTNLPHEEAVRDLLWEGERPYDVADVTGLPWIEIDFPGDVARAEREVLPHLAQPAGAER